MESESGARTKERTLAEDKLQLQGRIFCLARGMDLAKDQVGGRSRQQLKLSVGPQLVVLSEFENCHCIVFLAVV